MFDCIFTVVRFSRYKVQVWYLNMSAWDMRGYFVFCVNTGLQARKDLISAPQFLILKSGKLLKGPPWYEETVVSWPPFLALHSCQQAIISTVANRFTTRKSSEDLLCFVNIVFHFKYQYLNPAEFCLCDYLWQMLLRLYGQTGQWCLGLAGILIANYTWERFNSKNQMSWTDTEMAL